MKKPTILKYLFLCLAFLLFATSKLSAQAPEQDCFSAIPVCVNSYPNPISYSGSGNVPNEVNTGISCLGAGELNSVWYIVTVQNSGNLSFNLTPFDLTDDYDWAVFNLTNNACADIFNDASLQVSCNFSGSTFPTGVTGPNDGTNPQDESSIPVLAGETYVVCVSNFSSTANGYTIDFSASTASITDVTAPGVIGVSLPIACGTNQLTFQFSESVKCSTVDLSDFTLSGPNGPIAITAVSGDACNSGGTFESTFTFTLATPLTTSGQYHLGLVGPVTDNCGNAALYPADFPFDIVSVTANTIVTDEFCGYHDGKIEIQPSGGTAPYTYQWGAPIDTETGATVIGLDAGNYTCVVKDANNCETTITATVNDPLSFTVSVTSTNDLCTSYVGTATATVNGGVGPFSYKWNDVLMQTTPVATTLGGGIYTVTVTDINNPTCQQQADAVILDFNDVVAGFYPSPPEVSYLDPTVIFRNTSTNAVSSEWDFGGTGTSIDENPTHTFPETPGFYNVRLIVTSPTGCTDTMIIPVRVVYDLNFYAPSAFTPNGDLINEEWKVYSDGINYNDYEIYIFDRWGNKVYYSINPFESWNGAPFNQGDILPDGIYVYHIRFKQLYDNIEHKYVGKIALIK